MKETVQIGDIVHYVLPDGQHRPAIVVKIWNPTCVNMIVFADGLNDGGFGYSPAFSEWKTSVLLDENPNEYVPGTFLFREKQ